MMRALLTALIIMMAAGCAATWPSVCPVEDKARRCKCAVATFKVTDHPDKPSPPAGMVTLDCDGVAVPVKVMAEKVQQ